MACRCTRVSAVERPRGDGRELGREVGDRALERRELFVAGGRRLLRAADLLGGVHRGPDGLLLCRQRHERGHDRRADRAAQAGRRRGELAPVGLELVPKRLEGLLERGDEAVDGEVLRLREQRRETEVEDGRRVEAEERQVHRAHQGEGEEQRLLDVGLDRHLAPRAVALLEARGPTVFRGRDAAEELGHQLEVDVASQQRLDHFRDFGAHVRRYTAAAHSLPGQFLQGGQGVLARLVVVYRHRALRVAVVPRTGRDDEGGRGVRGAGAGQGDEPAQLSVEGRAASGSRAEQQLGRQQRLLLQWPEHLRGAHYGGRLLLCGGLLKLHLPWGPPEPTCDGGQRRRGRGGRRRRRPRRNPRRL